MEGLVASAIVLVAALMSVGLIQAFIGLAKRFGLTGAAINLYAIAVGIALAVLAKAVFPEVLTMITYPQVAVFGALNGLSTTGLWEWRRGDGVAG